MKNDIDLIQELDELLFTELDTDPISRPLLWTKFRRGVDDKKINCLACNPSNNVGYVEGQIGCPYCNGRGYMFDQLLIKGYCYKQSEGSDNYNLKTNSKAGLTNTTRSILVTTYDIKPIHEDLIYIPKLENNLIKVPLEFEETFQVVFRKEFKGSTNSKDFNISYLGG